MRKPELKLIDAAAERRRTQARERARRYRARKDAGLRVLRIAVDEEHLAILARSGLIDPQATEHDPDLEDAFNQLIATIAQKIGSRVTDPATDDVT